MIDDTTGPRVIQDVDLVLIGNTIAMEGGLNVLKDSLFHEEVSVDTKNSINVLVTTSDKKNDPGILKLGELYHNDDTQKYIEQEFGGSKVPVSKPISFLKNREAHMRIAIITAMEEEMAPFRNQSQITARSQVGKVIVEEAIYRDQP